MIEEQQRHQYLEALGISSWLPRAPLPGAAPSPDWVRDFCYEAPDGPYSQADAEAGAEVPPAAVAVKNPAAARAMLARSFGGDQAEPVKKPVLPVISDAPIAGIRKSPVSAPPESVASEAATARGADKAARQAPRFNLAFCLCGDVLLIDSLPPRSQAGFTDLHRHLADAIVASLSSHNQPMAETPFLLPWPTFASPTLSQSYEDARSAVQHKLDKVLSIHQINVVLMMGESAAQMILDRDEPLESLSGIVFSLRSGVKALASHSLTEALHVPGIKPVIWQNLQPLLKHNADG